MKNLFDYALNSIFRFGFKNFAISVIFAFLVFLISCAVFINSSLKHEYREISKDLPQILIQKTYGGKTHLISEAEIEKFYKFKAVKNIQPRVWGQYFFERENAYLSIFGVSEFSENFSEKINEISQNLDKFPPNFMITSKNVLKLLENQIKTYSQVPFFTPNDELISLKPVGEFKSGSELIDNDIILMSEANARAILGILPGFYSDVLLEISNENEVDFIAKNIAQNNQSLKVTTKAQMIGLYERLYDFKSGWFLLFSLLIFASFGVILYDKASGISSEERREIAILKALGWEISDIMKAKMIENFILSVFAFFVGFALAIFFVYVLQAPFLREIFVGFGALKINFNLTFTFDFEIFSLLFLLSVPFYIAFSLIPAFKVASSDVGEVIK